MKIFGFATVIASGLVAAILGLAAPAQAATLAEPPTAVASAINIPPGSTITPGSMTSSRMSKSRGSTPSVHQSR